MAWIPTTPETRTVAGPPVSQEIDRYKIREMIIDCSTTQTCLTVAEGYDDEGQFVEVARRQVIVDPGNEHLLAIMAAMGDETKSLYNNIRDSSYELLLLVGELPAGSEA